MEVKENKLRTVIVDDEFHARKLLTEYVSRLPIVELAGAVSNAFDCMTLLQTQPADLLLLDIEMPEVSGMEFVRSLKNPPLVIFITAYSDYAVESYELEVVDYLLKPVAFPRFVQAIQKAIEKKGLALPPSEEQHPHPNESLTKIMDKFITIKDGNRIYKINYADLLYIEGQREYVTFHTTKGKITTLYTLKRLEEELPDELFVRIHKSYIVSFLHIEMVERHQLTLCGTTLPVGSNYRAELLNRLNLG